MNINKKSILLVLLFTLAMIFSANAAFATDNTTENVTKNVTESNITLETDNNLTVSKAAVYSSYQVTSAETSANSLEDVAALWVWSTSLSSIDPEALEDAGYTDVFVFTPQDGTGITVINNFINKFSGTSIRIHPWISCFAYKGTWWKPHDTTRQNYVKNFISNIIDGCPGIAGIHLDYVRYGGTAYIYGVEFSTNTITNFVSDVRDLVKGKNSDLYLSAAVMPECSVNAYYYGQDYGKLSPYLDFMSPMIYKGNYNKDTTWIGTTTKWIVDHSSTLIVSGIMTYKSDSNPTPLPLSELQNDARIALANGSEGFALFRYGLIVANFAPKTLFVPTPTAGSPARNAINVPIDTIITTTFSEPIFAGTMQIELKNSAGTSIPIITAINGNVLTITPINLLVKATTYTIILHTGSVIDSDGNPNKYYTRPFTTDSTPPQAIAGSPARNAINVPIDKIITTTFNEPIKANNMWITLKTTTGTIIPITTTINNNILTITPTNTLQKATKYLIELHTGCISDEAGNPLKYYYRYFTTESV